MDGCFWMVEGQKEVRLLVGDGAKRGEVKNYGIVRPDFIQDSRKELKR